MESNARQNRFSVSAVNEFTFHQKTVKSRITSWINIHPLFPGYGECAHRKTQFEKTARRVLGIEIGELRVNDAQMLTTVQFYRNIQYLRCPLLHRKLKMFPSKL